MLPSRTLVRPHLCRASTATAATSSRIISSTLRDVYMDADPVLWFRVRGPSAPIAWPFCHNAQPRTQLEDPEQTHCWALDESQGKIA